MKYCIIRLFSDYNFRNETIKFIHYGNAKTVSYSDLNKLVENNTRTRSIIIDRIPF